MYPFTGSAKMAKGLGSWRSVGDQHETSFMLTPEGGAEPEATHLDDALRAIEKHLSEVVGQANQLIVRERDEFTDVVRAILEPRWRTARMLRGALVELGIPLSKQAHSPMSVPLTPAALALESAQASSGAGTPQWRLADDLAEGVVQTIASFGAALERLPRTAERLIGSNEETLRDVLLFILNANYKGRVTGETFIGEGKSDLLLRWEDRDAFVGECKLWRGQKGLGDGIEQLLSRYTLWRQTRVVLVVFIRDAKNATAIIEAAHDAIATHPRTRRRIDVSEPMRRGDYEVAGSSDQRRSAHLTFLPVVIARPG